MKKEKKVDSISTFLGSDANFEGTIEFQGSIRIDGRVKGKICSEGGTLIVGEKAVVEADIIAGAVIVMGELNGTIDAKERIEVYPPGRLGGNVQTAVISIKPGGIFDGNCTMKFQATPSKKAPVPSKISSVSTDAKGD
ncbi:MAG: polymer-forming cytoskeletal protein [Desulfobacterales bacterium]|jgi:cytoskeletal protein CcmA (bactofilin family)